MKLFRNNKHLAAQNRLAALDIVLKNHDVLIRESSPRRSELSWYLAIAQNKAQEILSWAYSESSKHEQIDE